MIQRTNMSNFKKRMIPKNRMTKVVSLRIDAKTIKEFNDLCEERGVVKQELLRWSIEQAIEKMKETK